MGTPRRHSGTRAGADRAGGKRAGGDRAGGARAAGGGDDAAIAGGQSLRGTILEARDLRSEMREVPEWGVIIELREFSGIDRVRFSRLVAAPEGGRIDLLRFYAAAVAIGAHEPGGGKIFRQGDSEIEGEIEALKGKSATVIFDLGKRILRDLSGIGDEAQEETEKNSGSEAASG